MTRAFVRHKYHKERLEYNEEIGNHLPCKKEELWKPIYEVWYSVAPKVPEELNNSMPGELQMLLCCHWNVSKVCCCISLEYI